MEMSIDEAIHAMEYYDECHIITQRQARAKAVGVMQKYQKIEKIIKNAGIFAFDVPEIRRIAEVMKDE